MNNKIRREQASTESMLDAQRELARMGAFSGPSSRRVVLKTGLGLAVVVSGVGAWLDFQHGSAASAAAAPTPTPAAAAAAGTITPNVAIQWNNAALQAIRNVSPGPTIGSRVLAIMHTCMYDAWAAYDPRALPTRPNGIPRQKTPKDVSQAVSYAAYRALVDLFPVDLFPTNEIKAFDSLMHSLGFDPNNTTTDIKTQAGVGNVAAQAVISYRHTDGSNQLGDLHPGPYSDYTNYVPVNTPTQINDPTKWQPLLVNGNPQKYTTPHWGNVTPFALTSGSQFRPTTGPVRDASSPAYKNQADQILQYSAQLNDQTKTIADYWANGPHSETPPGHWELFTQFVSAQYISAKDKHALTDDVLLFFALSNAVFDAGIACWECKRYYNSMRPITAVRFLYNGTQINAWGGYNQGTKPIDGGSWLPYQEANVVTPPFPEYVSGHSTFSAASAYILQQATGSDTFGNSFTAAPGSSLIEPNFAPSASVTLSWPTYSAAAAEAGLSRQYGGIHFNQGDQDGRALGKQVAMQVGAKVLTYMNGTKY